MLFMFNEGLAKRLVGLATALFRDVEAMHAF
jgi:hypothetical protein